MLFLDATKVSLYAFLGVLWWLGYMPWWVVVAVVWYDAPRYHIGIKIPFVYKRMQREWDEARAMMERAHAEQQAKSSEDRTWN